MRKRKRSRWFAARFFLGRGGSILSFCVSRTETNGGIVFRGRVCRPVPAHDGREDDEAGACFRRRVRGTAGCVGTGEGPARRVRRLCAAPPGAADDGGGARAMRRVDGRQRRGRTREERGPQGDSRRNEAKHTVEVTMHRITTQPERNFDSHYTRKTAPGHLS